jgi:hypothetical protein
MVMSPGGSQGAVAPARRSDDAMTETMDEEGRAARIEAYAGRAAETTRKVVTRAYAAADKVMALTEKPRGATMEAWTKASAAAAAFWAKVVPKDGGTGEETPPAVTGPIGAA